MKFSRKIGAEAWSIFTCGNAEIMVYIWCRRLCVCKLNWRKCSVAQPSPAHQPSSAQPNVGLHNVRAARTRHQRTLSCLLLTTTGDPSLIILLWLCWCWLNESGYHRGYQPSAQANCFLNLSSVKVFLGEAQMILEEIISGSWTWTRHRSNCVKDGSWSLPTHSLSGSDRL